MEVVLLNVFINVCDVMFGKGMVKIYISNEDLSLEDCVIQLGVKFGFYVCIVVMDNGLGIFVDILLCVMDLFFIIKDEGKGIGLGLLMVYGFVK